MHFIETETSKVLGGKVEIVQPKKGERVGIDPVLLARFTNANPTAHAVDLGTGTGIIAALLLYLGKVKHITAIEIMPEFANMARETAKLNGLADRMEVIETDLRNFANPPRNRHKFDMVVSNPPYYPTGRGALPPDPLKAAARHELYCTLTDVLTAAAQLLKPNGEASFIYPSSRLAEFLSNAKDVGLYPHKIRFIHPRSEEPSVRFMATLTKKESEVRIEPPLIVHPPKGSNQKYTAECEAYLR